MPPKKFSFPRRFRCIQPLSNICKPLACLSPSCHKYRNQDPQEVKEQEATYISSDRGKGEQSPHPHFYSGFFDPNLERCLSVGLLFVLFYLILVFKAFQFNMLFCWTPVLLSSLAMTVSQSEFGDLDIANTDIDLKSSLSS